MRVRVEVADTPWKLAKGLMHRDRLPSDAGMLFLFNQSRILSFWGENTYIPLDIAFVTKDHKIAKIGAIEKLSKKAVVSDVPCLMAIEVNAGFFDAHGIKAGDDIRIENDKWDGIVVQFEKNGGEGIKKAERKNGISLTEIVTAWTRRKKVKDYAGQMNLPFGDSDRPIDEEQTPVQASPVMQGDTGLQATQNQPNEMIERADDSELPQLSLDDIQFADDDEDVSENEEFDPNQVEQPEEQEPEEVEESVPDASEMDNYEAINEAIQNNRVMWIQYTTALKKPKIGYWGGNRVIYRIVEPHGLFHARTTGNNILVTFDETVGGIRAFIIDRIGKKVFTGEKFQKKFVVTH